MVRRNGWSHLCILSEGGRWYRDQRLYRYFDRLADDGFFEDFDQVLFFGAGQGGYAAAAYSVAAPGSHVLAVRPVATLDPAQAGWDGRHRGDLRLCFKDRYGYAPDMLEAAAQAWIVFDPREREDAMHAALYRAPNVMALRAFGQGADVVPTLDKLGILNAMIEAAMEGSFDLTSFGASTAHANARPITCAAFSKGSKAGGACPWPPVFAAVSSRPRNARALRKLSIGLRPSFRRSPNLALASRFRNV